MAEQTIEEGDDVAAIEEEQRERVLEEFSEAFLDTEDDTPETLAEGTGVDYKHGILGGYKFHFWRAVSCGFSLKL